MYPYHRVNIFIVPWFSMKSVISNNDRIFYTTKQVVIHIH
jgi:hypothetical protein